MTGEEAARRPERACATREQAEGRTLRPRHELAASIAAGSFPGTFFFLADLAPGPAGTWRAFSDVVRDAAAAGLAGALEGVELFLHGGSLVCGLWRPGAENAGAALERARERVRTSSEYSPSALDPAIGFAPLEPALDIGETVARADRALARAKAGPSRVVAWSPDLNAGEPGDPLSGILTGDAAEDYVHVRLLADALTIAASAPGLDDFRRRFLDRILAATGAGRAALLLMTSREPHQVLLARNDRGEDLPALSGYSLSIPREAFETGRGMRVTREDGEATPSESMERFRLRSVLCVPLRSGEGRIGVLYLDGDAEDIRFAEADLRFLQAVADRLAPGIEELLRREERLRSERAAREALAEENESLRRGVEGELVVRSQAFARAVELARMVAPTDTTVLLTGESGTGKERIARLIHGESRRGNRPLVVVNCAAIPRELLESELFGHEKGAFTGAAARREGKFQQADGGTLFLDEVGEIPIELQAKLLRFLQQGELERVGGTGPVVVDVRVVAATNRNLEEAAAKGAFRQDLFFRLNVFPIALPPVRERREEIPHLFDSGLGRAARRMGRPRPAVSREALAVLAVHPWPGNVREIENCAERAIILCGEGEVRPEHLGIATPVGPPAASAAPAAVAPEAPAATGTLQGQERDLILRALAQAGGKKAEAARILGIPRTSLYHKLREHGIED